MATFHPHVRALLAGTFLALVASVHAEESVLYVVPSNPNAAAPYDTWETASDDIVSAINNAASSSTVYVAKGTYKTTASIVVPLAVKVFGATAPLDSRFVSCVLDDTSKYGFGKKERLFIEKDSPCFGAASPQGWMASSRDLYGRPRILNGACDIGAVEYRAAPGTYVSLQ